MSSGPEGFSTQIDVSRDDELYVNVDDEINEGRDLIIEVNEEPSEFLHNTTNKEAGGLEDDNPFHDSKRPRRSKVWDEFHKPEMIKGQWKVKCKYCTRSLSVLKSKSTTHMHRHLESCMMKAKHVRQQSLINFLPSDSSAGANQSGFVSALHNGKLEMLKMREGIAHWITMHGHPFSIVEEEGFNLMMKRGIAEWKHVSRVTIKSDSFKVYELEKKKLKDLFKNVERISLTTDLWKSKPQKIEYMVLTAHFVDLDWKLQKRVINFVHLPPPRKGANVADCILTCLREWKIEDKVFTISVDNTSANDSCIKNLKDNFKSNGRLICDGRLFHVRCCAHILNIMVQHGLQQVKHIIEKVHDTVAFLNSSGARLQKAFFFRSV